MMFSTQQAQAVSFNHSRFGISIKKIGNCFVVLSVRMSRWLQHRRLAVLGSEQARLWGPSPPSAMQAYREKTPGEWTLICGLKTWVSPEYQTAFFTGPKLHSELLLLVLIQLSHPSCLLLFGMTNPPEQATIPPEHQHLCKPPDVTCWHYKLFLCFWSLS